MDLAQLERAPRNAVVAESAIIHVQQIAVALTVDESAQVLRTSRSNVYLLLESGDLKSFTLGRKRLITGESIAQLMSTRLQAKYAPMCEMPQPESRKKRPVAR